MQVDTGRASFLTNCYLCLVGYMHGLTYAFSFCLFIQGCNMAKYYTCDATVIAYTPT